MATWIARVALALALPVTVLGQTPPSDSWSANRLRNELRGMAPSELADVRRRAEAGSALDQFRVGLAYEYGLAGVELDLGEALRWHKRAAEHGVGAVEAWIGDFYYDGIGVKVDHAEALSWYRLGASHGHARSTRFIGDFTLYGQGTARSVIEAAAWYEKAAAAGDATAKGRLALLTPACADEFCAALRTIIISRDNGFRDLRGPRRREPLRELFAGALKPDTAEDCQITGTDPILELSAQYECSFQAPFVELARRVRSALPAGWSARTLGPEVLSAGPDGGEPVVTLSGYWLRVVAPQR